jgi:hypothetical protein
MTACEQPTMRFPLLTLVVAAMVACGTASGSGDEPISADAAADAAAADDSVGDTASPTCSVDADCDDKIACTDDKCGDAGHCQWLLQADSCLIHNVCVAQAAANKSNTCLRCDPNQPHSWSMSTDGASCEDTEPCTGTGACTQGKCLTTPLKCSDDNPCTVDSCKLGVGCEYMAGGTPACDDGNLCTIDDACTDGACIGAPDYCDDSDPCTDDACKLANGCTHTNNDAPCEDGDLCTDADSCKDGKCAAGGPTNCDDGNACTIDMCEDFAGCGHLATKNPCCTGKVSICDDGDPCTTDLCDPKTSKCSKKLNTAVCSDDDKCTLKDTCTTGKCVGTSDSCDDKNACTKDACDPANGCVHSTGNDGGACDDGNPCTKTDKCAAGLCKGSGKCTCKPKFSSLASKLNVVQLGKGGQPGEGLDIDGDKKTCAPKANCKDGIDNATGGLATLVNPQLTSAIEKGSVMLVVEFDSLKQGSVNLSVHQADLHAGNLKCDHMKAHCQYTASMSLLNAVTCKSKVKLTGTLTGNVLEVGGKGTVFPLTLPIQPGVNLAIKIYNAQIKATTKMSGGKVIGFTGLLVGAIPKKSLADAIKALPEEDLPLPKETLLNVLNTAVEQDQDVDGDGKKDASSIGLKIEGIGATLIDAK